MLVILKIPIAYLAWVVWWAVKAEPEVGSSEGDTAGGVEWRPWRRPSGPRPVRGGPHGSPHREAGRERRRERAGA